MLLVPLTCVAACSGTNQSEIFSLSSDTRDLYVSPSKASGVLDSSAECCQYLSEISYTTVDYNQIVEVDLDSAQQAFPFTTGKSFLAAYELPKINQNLPVTINSLIGDTLFAPTIALLNEDFQVTRVITYSSFNYVEAEYFRPNMMQMTFLVKRAAALENEKEAYMLVYSTESDRAGSTQIVHPLRTYAKAQNKADPGVADPFIPHSALGQLEVRFNDANENGVFSDTPLVGGSSTSKVSLEVSEQQIAPEEPEVKALKASEVTSFDRDTAGVGAKKATSVSQERLSEAESFYNQLIKRYVAEGDIGKALTLVEEAEAIGSKTARETFVEAVKSN